MSTAWAFVRVWLAPISLYALTLTAIAAVGGGWIALGRVDPLLVLPGAGWAAVVAIWASRGQVMAKVLVAAAATGAAMLAIVALVDADGQVPLGYWLVAAPLLLVTVGAAGLLTALARRFPGKRRWVERSVLFICLPIFALTWTAVAWRELDNVYRVERRDDLKVGLVSSLPLRSQRDVASMLRPSVDEPAYRFLQRTTRLVDIAHVDAASLAGLDVLLLAHPPPLAPDQLVEIDNWAQGGGRVVILADGLSSWAPPYPLGDPRNPPITSLLGPLLSHWGVELDAPERLTESRVVIRDSGQRLHFFSPGRLRKTDFGCLLSASRIVADCTVGSGRAVLIADADFLDARYWAGSRGGESTIDWTSGNMLWLFRKFGGDRQEAATVSRFRPSWSLRRDALDPDNERSGIQ